MPKGKKRKTIKLDRLETRFILNFLTDERNKMQMGGGFKVMNLRNIDKPIGEAFRVYHKKLGKLIKKLAKLEEDFYAKK